MEKRREEKHKRLDPCEKEELPVFVLGGEERERANLYEAISKEWIPWHAVDEKKWKS